ncbi:MAG: glycosyltransferase [Bacteroidetes bacterium]|nr:glycosyltransferase [Bacteroidota bacterium]
MSNPLVSVICLCYNQKNFVAEAVESVLHQTYKNIELIIVDDASTDGSLSLIKKIVEANSNIQYLLVETNVGNCKAFNAGWRIAKGEYIVDLSADDVMLPDRIEQQVNFFQQLDPSYGVIFTDCIYLDEHGNPFRNHFDYLISKRIIRSIPEGDVFQKVLTNYFISGPTMLIKNEVLKVLNGYDENLSYEDFDFWVRSSRIFKYGFLNVKTTLVRKAKHSKSTGWYQSGDPQLHSTYLICRKAIDLCKNEGDRSALIWRVAYEYRQSLFSKNKTEAKLFESLLHDLQGWNLTHQILKVISNIPLPWPQIRKRYHRFFYN